MGNFRAGRRPFPELPTIKPLDPTPLEEARERIEGMRAALGVTRETRIAGDLQDAREDLCEARKQADDSSTRGVHVEINELIESLDGLMARLAEEAA